MIQKVGELIVKVDINKEIKYPSQAPKDLCAIDLCDDEDTEVFIEEVMAMNEEVDLEELLLSEPILELNPLPCSLKYVFS